MRNLKLILGLAAVVALGSDQTLTGTAGNNGGGDRWRFRLRLVAPEPRVEKDPARPELGRVLTIPTFDPLLPGDGRTVAEGQIPLPVKVVRLAIPEGATVSLESIKEARRTLKGLRLGPERRHDEGRRAGETGPTATPKPGEEPVAASSAARRTARGAGSIRLGQIGYLRSQRFVEILYTPATLSADSPSLDAQAPVDLDFVDQVEADLVVDGVDWDRVQAEAAESGIEPAFEGTYRSALLNYDEGRRLRTRRGARRAGRTTRSSDGLLLVQEEAGPEAFGATGAAAAPAGDPGASLVAWSAALTPVYRVIVKVNGVYRLTGSYLSGQAPGLLGSSTSQLKLVSQGVEVPIRVVDDGDGILETADFLEFYGEGMLNEPDLIVNFDPNSVGGMGAPILQANDYTDENVYFLFGEAGTRARIPTVSGTVMAGPPLASSFQEKIHREVDNLFLPEGTSDPYYSTPFGGSIAGGTRVADPNAPNCGYAPGGTVQAMTGHLSPNAADGNSIFCPACNLGLPDVVSGSAAATVRVRLRGTSAEAGANPDHLAVVQVGTSSTPFAAACFDGEAIREITVSPTHTLLASGAGVFIGQPGLQSTASPEGLLVDWVEADYTRQLRLFGGDLRASFTNVDRTYEVANFTTATVAERLLYDVSRTVAGGSVRSPRLVTGGNNSGAGPFTRRVTLTADASLPGGAPRILVAVEPAGLRLPLRVEQVTGEDLTLPTLSADMIVVTDPAAADLSPGSVFRTYLDHRASDSGLTIRIVTMRDVYDSFSHGVQTPEALRAFLAYAYDNWGGVSGVEPPPAYALLVGDVSSDYKNNQGHSNWINQVPTFTMYQPSQIFDFWSSDTYVSAFRGADQLPDIHLGRISTRTIPETETVFQKLLDYDASGQQAASWRSRVLYLTDRDQSEVGTNAFRAFHDEVVAQWFDPPFDADKIYFDPNSTIGGPATPSAWRGQYTTAANDGAALTSYLGHGSLGLWGLSTLFNSLDVNHTSLLLPTGKPSFMINLNCLVGGFSFPQTDTLGEVFLKMPDHGAVASFSPAGLSFASVVVPKIHDSIYPSMFGLMKERRFGALATDAKIALATSLVDMQSYVLLGDPAQRLTLPAPRPPTGLDAAGGLNGRVDLSWTPGPDAGSLVRIYRATAPAGPYTLLNPAGASGSAYSDTTAISGLSYFYRAVSVDPAGPFEGAVTNLNSDCDTTDPDNVIEGPDCVHARPINTLPPSAPAGFRLGNPGTGSTLTALWNQPGEDDISEYSLSYGTSSNSYSVTITVAGSATSVTLSGLTPGQPYFARLTAKNFSGLTGAASLEATGIPSVYEGVNPPDVVLDLEVVRSAAFPDSIELSWTPPATDIYGSAAAVSSFSIYRGTTPFFVPDPNTNRIAVISNPSAASYVDPGAWNAPQSFFYLVTATDVGGFASGAGRQLPQGISNLMLERSGGSLVMLWSPVTQDIDGEPTFVDHYVLYSDTLPVGRSRIESLVPQVPVIAAPGVTVPVPPGALVFYSVIVVDVRGNKSPF